MDNKADQPLLDPSQRIPEFISMDTGKYAQYQEPKIIDTVEHIELRDAEPAIVPATTTTDSAGATETLQVTTETVKMKKEKKNKYGGQQQQSMSVGLNTFDRDEKMINGQVHIMFDDVIAEPDGTHTFENIWRGNYVIFNKTKIWFYRFLTVIFGWPSAFICGLVFALAAAFNNYIFTPFFKLFALVFFWIGKLWGTMFRELVDPVFESFGRCFANIRFTRGEPTNNHTIGTNTRPNTTTTGTNGGVMTMTA